MHPTPARLEVDLAFDADGDRIVEDGVRRIGFHVVAAAAKSPTALLALLRGARCETVVVRENGLPLSGVQAGALVLIGLVPARRWVHVRDERERVRSRSAFLASAILGLAPAATRELAHTLRLRRVVRTSARREYRLPRKAERPASVLYLRPEPTMRLQGELVGGAATHTRGVINGLLANGLHVRVVTPEPLAGIEGAEPLTVPPRRAMHVVRGVHYADYSQAIVAAGGRARADFVYQRHVLGGFAGLELARQLGVPLVLEFNGSAIWVEREWGLGRVRMERPLVALERRNLLDASLIVVVSNVLKEQLLATGIAAERVLVNPNGVDVERLARYREHLAPEWRERAGQPEQPTVGFIGTFGPWHGVELLPELIAATPAARWILIGGGGPLHARVSAEIEARGLQERVLMPGLVPRSRALELLSACDVCVSPHVPNTDGSRFFGSPTKLFEYMGLGKAIVASDLEQIGTVIEHGHSGLLYPPGDIAKAAAAIDLLLGDAALRERLGTTALAHAEEHYSWTAHVRRILDTLALA
jgi:glycosyltransferase involved in cell wall biosynthesis